MISQSTELIPRMTVQAMVGAYKQAEVKIRDAFQSLMDAEQTLKAAFGDTSYRFDLDSAIRNRHGSFERPEETLEYLRRDVWRSLVDKMGIRQILSTKRLEQLDRQIEKGQDEEGHKLPAIEEANVLAMMEGTAMQAESMVREMVREVYEMLTPQRSAYKTNEKCREAVGLKVIKTGWIRPQWHGGKFEVDHYHHDQIRAVNKVFYALDNRANEANRESYHGQLADAISKADRGVGETEFFRFKCYGNGNLHLEFKRPDLVQRLNQIAGAGTVRSGS